MIVEKQTFKARKISLDGGEFYSCTFDKCNLVFSGYLHVTLEDCTFKDCKWTFAGPAENTTEFMRGLYEQGAKNLIENIFRTIQGQQPGPGPTLH